MPPDDIKLPGDVPRGLPNCGVVAVSVFTGVSYREVEAAFRRVSKRCASRKWKGPTRPWEQAAVLKQLNHARSVGFRTQRKTLQRWAKENAWPGVTYMIGTTAHKQVLKDGYITDQGGTVHVSEHWGRRKFTIHAIAKK